MKAVAVVVLDADSMPGKIVRGGRGAEKEGV
jgi:hypothetical protein